MNIGDIVTLVKEAEQLPALVVKVYKDVHDMIVADVRVLTATHLTVPTVVPEDPTALHVVEGSPTAPVAAATAPVLPSAAETAAKTAADQATIADLQVKLAAAQEQLTADATAGSATTGGIATEGAPTA